MRVAFGEYQLDTKTRTLQCEGRRIPIQSKAFDLLAYLIERRDQVVSSDNLLDALWPGLHVTPAALSTAVQKARQAVGDDGEHQAVLQTEHGKGFRFVAEVTDLTPPEANRSVPETAQPLPETDQSGSAGVAQIPLLAELKRRNVFRVGVAYAIVAWLLVEVASVVLPTFNAPEWVMQVFTFLVILGFPVALVLAWAFELTPEGIKREAVVDPAASITQQTGRKLDFAIIGLLALAVVFLVVDNYVLDAEQVPAVESVTSGKSIAVLPFTNMSADPDQEYFADGISEELLNTLAQFEELRVVGRTSSFSFKGSDADLKEMGEALNADVILEGSVRTAGDRVRITAQLVDAKDGFHRWSETYDREFTDIFAIQTEIATAITNALHVSLSPVERTRLATPPTENLEAYQAYLLGRQRVQRETVAAYEEAIGYFQRAIELDPEFALPHVDLAITYMWQNEDAVITEELFAKAQAAVDRALELDDQMGDAHSALGLVAWFRNDFEGAEAAFQRGLELSPNSVSTNILFGAFLGNEGGRPKEGLDLHMKAVGLDPLSAEASTWVAADLRRMGRFEEAIRWTMTALEMEPRNAETVYRIGNHHARPLGRFDDAIPWWRRAVALDSKNGGLFARLGEGYLDLGDLETAKYWITRGIKLAPHDYSTNVSMHALKLYTGDEVAALEHGRKAFEIWPLAFGALSLIRDHEVRAGRYSEARALYEEYFPELLHEGHPKVDRNNYRAAVDLALILSRAGEQERAAILLDRSLQQNQTTPRLDSNDWITDVQIYTLRGEKPKALFALRQAIDAGWRGDWWYQLKLKPDLEPLHDEPEYQAMVAEIEADMAVQLARVRKMERNGELEPIPEVSATIQ